VIRIARIITRLNIGGPAIQAINLSHDLKAEGFETFLISGHLGQGEGDMTELLPVAAARTLHVRDLIRPVHPIRDIRALWSIYKALVEWRPHIVHTHMAKAGTLGRLACILYNSTGRRSRAARIVHTYHGHVFEGYFDEKRTRLFVMVERWLARRTDVLIAIASQVMKDVVTTYRIADASRVRLIPLGLDLDKMLEVTSSHRIGAREQLAICRDAVVVTTVGRLTAIKQHAHFLEMAQRLAEKSDRYRFLIVGDGELNQELRQRADQLGVTSCVEFLGWRADLQTVYAASDVFVLTSRNEGTPVALIEAMAAGLPTVSTDVGGVRDVISAPRVGTLVPFGRVDALTRAVLELVDDPARRLEMGRQARALVKDRFHRRRLVEDIVRLYRELAGDELTADKQ
jgi:glycosyltransferase involved in cell wall biosynthesis